MRVPRRGIRAISTLLGGVALLAVTAVPVAAECTGGLAPFRDAAPTAGRILIGTVTRVVPGIATDGVGRSPWFTVRVTDVVRGPRVTTLDVRDLAPGCSGDQITAAGGEVIALAIDAHGPGRWGTFSTVAWIHAAGYVRPANRITRAEVLVLASVAPETNIVQPMTAGGGGLPPLLPLAVAAVIGTAVWFRRTSEPARRVAGEHPGRD